MKRYAGLTYEQAVRKYADSVAKVCRVHLDNTADAEDCFQNTFFKLYTKSSISKRGFSEWLSTSAKAVSEEIDAETEKLKPRI